MKQIIFFAFVLMGFICVSCGGDPSEGQTEEQTDAPSEQLTIPTDNSATTTTTSANSAEHFMCPNGHVGFGGAAKGKMLAVRR